MCAFDCYPVGRWNSSSSSASWQLSRFRSGYLELFIIPSILTRGPVPAEEKQMQTMTSLTCFTLSMPLFCLCVKHAGSFIIKAKNSPSVTPLRQTFFPHCLSWLNVFFLNLLLYKFMWLNRSKTTDVKMPLKHSYFIQTITRMCASAIPHKYGLWLLIKKHNRASQEKKKMMTLISCRIYEYLL